MYNEIDELQKSVRALKNENMEHKARINALERMLTDTRTSVKHLYGRSDENILSHREYDEQLRVLEKHEKEISKLDDRIYIMENATKIEVEFNDYCETRFYIKDKEGVKNFIEDVTDEYSKNIEKLTKKDMLNRLIALEKKVNNIK